MAKRVKKSIKQNLLSMGLIIRIVKNVRGIIVFFVAKLISIVVSSGVEKCPREKGVQESNSYILIFAQQLLS
jgi:hypothetical protein